MKPIRKKKCVVCNEPFLPQYTTTQRACSSKCAYIYAKAKEAAKKTGLNKLRNEKKSKSEYQTLLRTTQEIVNEYIKLRDKGAPCVSCGQNWGSDFQACHVWPVNKHSMIRYDYDNIHGGCVGCNIHKEGNYDAYRFRLPKRIGQERYDALVKRAQVAHAVPFTYSRHELKEIQRDAREKINALKKMSNI